LDVNHNPDAMEAIPDVKVLLPSAEVGIGVNLMGWDFGFAGGLWVEYWTQSYNASQFKSLCEYQPQEMGTAFSSLLAQPLTDLNYIKENSAGAANKGYYFVAEALSIFTWQILADVWGGLPYFETFQGETNKHPKFDKGEDIHADLLKRIDALLAVDLSESTVEATYDYIYQGDLEKWKQFAYSLKLKLLLRVSETPGYDNAAVLSFIEDAATSFITASAKIPGTIWNDAVEGKRHPMREFEAGGANYLSTNLIACKSFLDYLQTNNDPRLPKLFTFSSGSSYRGAFFGDFDSKFASDGSTADDKVTYSKVNFAGNMDIPILSLWEVNFYIAEVYARAANFGKAKEYYNDAVAASIAQHGLTATITGTGDYAEWTSANTEDAIKQIAMQKWVAYANYQHVEAFLERNRTKYPPVNDLNIKSDRRAAYSSFPIGYLTISVTGRERLNGNLPASPIYPSAYLNRNNNAPSQKKDLSEKVWWDKKAGK
jgi:hypothetical protein